LRESCWFRTIHAMVSALRIEMRLALLYWSDRAACSG
jgi:hypothetical protein